MTDLSSVIYCGYLEWMIMKKRCNSDGQQFYQYQQNELLPSISNKKAVAYDIVNPDP